MNDTKIPDESRAKLDQAWLDLTKDSDKTPTVEALRNTASVGKNLAQAYRLEKLATLPEIPAPYDEIEEATEASRRALIDLMWHHSTTAARKAVQAQVEDMIATTTTTTDEAMNLIAKMTAERDEVVEQAARVPELEARITALESELTTSRAVAQVLLDNRSDAEQVREKLDALTAKLEAAQAAIKAESEPEHHDDANDDAESESENDANDADPQSDVTDETPISDGE